MIETSMDCQQFLAENEGDWIVHIVPIEEDKHPADNSPSILFIRVIPTGKTYYFAFDHPDSIPEVTHAWFVSGYLLPVNNIKWALDKKAFCQMLNLPNVYDANYCNFMKKNEIVELSEFDTSAHGLVRRNANGTGKINKSIPLMKHLEAFDDMCNAIQKMVCKLDAPMKMVNDVIIETLGYLEKVGICVDVNKFKSHYQVNPNTNGLVFSQYNIYTSTGRPSNRFGGVNYAALNAKDGSRASFISRYGNDGRIVVIDYAAFHPRIICMLTGYDMSSDTNIYEYLAKLYFHKTDVDDIDIIESKKLTFRQLYGGVEEKYSHIKYLSNLKTYIDAQWTFFNKNGYVLTPIFKRKLTDKHILEPNPAKVFNYILQAVEGEIAISKLQEVQKYLVGKKTKAILYTYDAIIYDFHKDDGIQTLNAIRNIMSVHGKFPMKTYIGESYQSVKYISL
jgi:hypothetical protein